MEKVEGRDYFNDLADFSGKECLEDWDIAKIRTMTSYLCGIHAVKKESKTLYWRKLRDTVGHGECLMGVFDMYPDGALPYEEMADIVKRSVDWAFKLKPRYKRLSQIHGDFHPGNIWFKETKRRELSAESEMKHGTLNIEQGTAPDFILLDRSRGPWGEPADDLTALTINYIFFSIRKHGDVRGAYLEGLKLFFNEYIQLSGDHEIVEVTAPFFAFRCAVVGNPVFYPDLGAEAKTKIFNFARAILSAERFEVDRINDFFLH